MTTDNHRCARGDEPTSGGPATARPGAGGGLRRAGGRLLGGLACGAVVGALLGLLEARRLAESYQEAHASRALPAAQYLHTTALDTLGFALVGLLLAAVWLAVPFDLTPVGLARRFWRFVRAGPVYGPRRAAAAWSLCCTAIVGFSGALALSRHLLFNHRSRTLISVALAGAFVVAGGLLWMLHRTLRFHLERLLTAAARRGPVGAALAGPGAFLVTLLGGATLAAALVVGRYPATLRALPLALLGYLGGGLFALAVGTDLHLRWRWRWKAAPAGVVVLAALALVGSSYASFGNDRPARRIAAAIQRFGVVSPQILKPLVQLSDHDDDGFGGRFGGGDCNDADAHIHPAAPEIPGNGVDENCSGEDLSNVRGVLPRRPPRSRVRRRPKPIAEKPNILWIVIDAMRADRAGWAGYRPRLTPHLDRLARRSTQFLRAYSPSNRTAVVFSGLLTGRYASELHRRGVYNIALTGQNRFVASLFQRAGYATLASVCHHSMNREHGRHRGFDRWRVFHSRSRHQFKREVTSPRTTENALTLLEEHLAGQPAAGKGRKPFFLLTYYFDPHWRYLRHEGHGKVDGQRIDSDYDVEIRYTDAHIGRLLTWLERRALLRNTIVVVTADHGEAFGEHGAHRHGYNLYEEQIRVPLLIHVPGLARRRVRAPVSTMDLPRTLLELAGLETDWPLQGRSLVPLLTSGPPPSERVVYVEQLPSRDSALIRALVVGRWKLIHRTRGNLYELYDLERDPRERNNLALRARRQLRRMRRMYEAFVATRLRLRPAAD